ncbi:MAG: hypothetical protein JO243_17295 [Solirubrobacterales bacterium]|nr:hypothetical protein [Solirubrobacterales bacterium]
MRTEPHSLLALGQPGSHHQQRSVHTPLAPAHPDRVMIVAARAASIREEDRI